MRQERPDIAQTRNSISHRHLVGAQNQNNHCHGGAPCRFVPAPSNIVALGNQFNHWILKTFLTWRIE